MKEFIEKYKQEGRRDKPIGVGSDSDELPEERKAQENPPSTPTRPAALNRTLAYIPRAMSSSLSSEVALEKPVWAEHTVQTDEYWSTGHWDDP